MTCHIWSQTVVPLVSCIVDNRNPLFKVMPSLLKVFLQVIDLCSVHALQIKKAWHPKICNLLG